VTIMQKLLQFDDQAWAEYACDWHYEVHSGVQVKVITSYHHVQPNALDPDFRLVRDDPQSNLIKVYVDQVSVGKIRQTEEGVTSELTPARGPRPDVAAAYIAQVEAELEAGS
tara:strand:- start:5696 stop:6031 length:336 start_codon:yes stop_codon:yes gene_type:complete